MRLVPLVVFLILSAGCVAPAGDEEGPQEPEEPESPLLELPWSLEECRFVIAVVAFDPAVGAELLPEGFSFGVGDPLPIPLPVLPAQATMGVEIFSCRSGDGYAGQVAPIGYGSVYFPVVPPAHLSAGEEAGHYLKMHVLIPDADRRAWFEGAGADVTGGSNRVFDDPPRRAATMTLDTLGEIRIDATVLEEGGAFGGFRFREFTPADSGLVVWDAVASSPGTFTGEGILVVPPGSLPARIMGSHVAVVPMFGGTYTFAEGSVRLPG